MDSVPADAEDTPQGVDTDGVGLTWDLRAGHLGVEAVTWDHREAAGG